MQDTNNEVLSPEAPIKEILTLEEAAELLQVSTQTVMKAVKLGQIPAVKIGAWRFSRRALIRYVETGGKYTNEQ